MLRKRLGVKAASFALAAVAVCAACSRTAYVPAQTGNANPSAIAAIAGRTTAYGVLVDDPSGSPLKGVPVRLEPWKACTVVTKQQLDCPKPVTQTTTAWNGRFKLTAKPGHYLLVIGSDSTSDLARPTIHDNVTLRGGLQKLVAPTMPPVPPIAYTPPPVELHGQYRLVTLDATTEVPCIQDFDQQRMRHRRAKIVTDEWLMENERAIAAWFTNPKYRTATPIPGKTHPLTTGNSQVSGGSDCVGLTAFNSDGPALFYAKNSQTQWFGGRYDPYHKGSKVSAYGADEFPPDPRAFTDPNYPIWP